MNPRFFCRDPGYPRAIALTYSFHPLFFERIILRDLWYGGTGDISIIADQGEVQDAITRYAGQFNFLGKKYLLSAANTRGAFHPKVLLRIGPKGAKLLLGTGNMTFAGWGGNKDLALDLALAADNPESPAIVNNVLDHITPYLTTDSAREGLARIRDYPWLIGSEGNVDHTLLLTKPEQPLAEQLLKRWSGRRFSRMFAFTGSTDEKGAFIEWCHRQFGVDECVISVSPENSSFLKQEIDKLPVKVLLAPFSGPQRLHAKFFWFDGPDGPAAIVGSANCSRAAWLMAPVDGGNVEAIHVYDSPNADDFQGILDLLPKEREKVEKIASPDGPETPTEHSYYLRAVNLHRSLEFIEAEFNQILPDTARVSLIGLDGLQITLSLASNNHWQGIITEETNWPEETILVSAEIDIEGKTFKSPLHWVDDLDEIHHASRTKQVTSSFGGLISGRNDSEHAKVVADLAMISSSIFAEKATFADPQFQHRKHLGDEPAQQKAEPVRPEDLIKSLNELDIKEQGQNNSFGPVMSFSMFGVMRALFEEVGAVVDDPLINPEAIVTEESSSENGHIKKQGGAKGNDREPPPDRYKLRLRKQLEDFFENFSSKKFAEECTATKLVQTAAFPLAVSLLGQRGGWLSHEEARIYVTRVVDILLNRQRPGADVVGLLGELGERYKEKDQYEVFLQVVGDGTLWIAILAILAQLKWEEGFERFERAINSLQSIQLRPVAFRYQCWQARIIGNQDSGGEGKRIDCQRGSTNSWRDC